MSNNKLIGLILFVVGIGLVIWGYQLSDSVGSQLTKAISGSYSDKVMLMYIGGAVCLMAGLFMTIKK